MLNILAIPFKNLSPQQLYDLMKLRVEVFIVEQSCLYQDLDDKDQQAIHFLAYKNNKLAAYARFLFDTEKHAYSIGRVITSKSFRKQGLAKQLMDEVISYSCQNFPTHDIVISAQCYISEFYESLGFMQTGTPYDEDGLPHIKMIRKATSLHG